MNYNPMLDYQRNQLLAQQYQNQIRQFNPYPQQQFITQAVGSVDEARAFPVDPGTTYLFPDTGTGKIYMKRLNTNTGRSDWYEYQLIEKEAPSMDPIQQINARLTGIEKTIGVMYESISSNAGNEKPNGGNAAADAPKNEAV